MRTPAPARRVWHAARRLTPVYVAARDLETVLATARHTTLVVLDSATAAVVYPDANVKVVGQHATPIERVNRWAEPRQAARTPGAVFVPIRPVRHEPVFETEWWQTLTVRRAS